MSFSTWEEVVRAAALGDEEATAVMAQRLAGVEQEQGQKQAKQSGAAAEYNGLLSAYKKHSGDIWDDPEGLKLAERKLQSLIRNNPDMTLETAFEYITDSARGLLGPPEERGNKEWIAQQKQRRYGNPEEGGITLNETEEYVPDAEDRARSEDIAALAASRGPHANYAAEEEREYEARKPKAQRGARQFPHVDPRESSVPVYNRYGQRIA
jgi:hypothetical protein